MRILVLAFLVLIAGVAEAHRVNLFVYVEEDTVYAEGYFPDGGACRDCLVEVLELDSGEKLLKGTTDEEGMFSFKLPEKGPLKVVLDAGMGHRDEYILRSGPAGPEESVSEEGKVQENGLQALDQVLEKRLKPMEQRLLRIEQRLSRPGLTEVIGGIGFIVGIFGILLYLKGRGRR